MYCHTEQRRTRRIVYNKAIDDTVALLCEEVQRWLFVSFISCLSTEHFPQKLYRNCMEDLRCPLCRQYICGIAF